MPGVLRVKGTIDLTQFWPDGESDADTTKIKVNVGGDSFAFAPDGKAFKPTKAFEDAYVRGASRELVITHDKKTNQDRITVRLQGVDAPELHYRAPAIPRSHTDVSAAKRTKFNDLNKVERRQYWAETATVALHKKLSAFGAGTIPCEVDSFVEHPYEVIDTYGRFVANIRVGSGFDTDINVWLAEEGWVFPTYYSSMSVAEIETLDAAAKKGQAKKRVWSQYSREVNKFDKKLVYRRHGAIEAAKDKGPVLMPKLFRRQVAHQMQKAAGIKVSTFAAFLGNADPCFKTCDFIKEGIHTATPQPLSSFVKGSKFTLRPQELVFQEKFSTLVDAHGKTIKDF